MRQAARRAGPGFSTSPRPASRPALVRLKRSITQASAASSTFAPDAAQTTPAQSAAARGEPERRAAAVAAAGKFQRRPFDRPRGAGERFRRAEPFDRRSAGRRRLRRRDEQADRRRAARRRATIRPAAPARRRRAGRRSSVSLRPGPARSRRVSWLIWSAATPSNASAGAAERSTTSLGGDAADDAGPSAFGRRPQRRQRRDADHRQRRRRSEDETAPPAVAAPRRPDLVRPIRVERPEAVRRSAGHIELAPCSGSPAVEVSPERVGKRLRRAPILSAASTRC